MPVAVTQSALRARVRTATRQPNANGFVSDAEINTLIQEGAYELYDLLVAAKGAEYYGVAAALNTAPGQAEYGLPNNFYRLVALALSDTAGTGNPVVAPPSGATWWEPRRFAVGDYALQESRTISHPSQVHYALTGAQAGGTPQASARIRFLPAPPAVWCLRYLYLPTLDLTPDGSGEPVYDGINGWESYVVAHAAITIAGMEESDPGLWIAKKAEIKARIAGLAVDRDQAQPQRVSDRRFGAHRRLRRYPWP